MADQTLLESLAVVIRLESNPGHDFESWRVVDIILICNE
jgi:hypothetical protein